MSLVLWNFVTLCFMLSCSVCEGWLNREARWRFSFSQCVPAFIQENRMQRASFKDRRSRITRRMLLDLYMPQLNALCGLLGLFLPFCLKVKHSSGFMSLTSWTWSIADVLYFNFGYCRSHSLNVWGEWGQLNRWNGSGGMGVWGGWDWWKSQAAIKGEKMKWHLTLLDAGEWCAATEVQSSTGTSGNQQRGERETDRTQLMWGERMVRSI